jgi:ergothioneine biosynthesis protein EgtB
MDLLNQYKNVRKASLAMCEPLATEDYVPQPIYFASPPKWNLGHTTWFFETFILSRYLCDYRVYHPDFGFLFNSYYNNAGTRTLRHERGLITRPTVAEVEQYREYVDRHMVQLLQAGPADAEMTDLVTLGIHHEQQHQELFFTDLKYAFACNPLYPAYGEKAFCESPNAANPGPEWVDLASGIYEIGHSDENFAFDNEKKQHQVYINACAIQNSLVTNGDFLEFIDKGGYDDFNHWHDEGWHWRKTNAIEHPQYWQKKDGKWYQFTLAGLREVQPDHVLCHVSYYEAAAYASFRQMRLPTEFEWEAASDHLHWGQRWEWTESAYLPYPGFKKAEGAVGEYNGKFMVNQKVLRGASVATAPGHSRKTYRNFFHPEMFWQFNGIRLAKDLEDKA